MSYTLTADMRSGVEPDTEPEIGATYATWRGNGDTEFVTVIEHSPSGRLECSRPGRVNRLYDGPERGRIWARISPEPVRGWPYLVIDRADYGSGSDARIGTAVSWGEGSDTDYTYGSARIARLHAGGGRYVRNFVALAENPHAGMGAGLLAALFTDAVSPGEWFTWRKDLGHGRQSWDTGRLVQVLSVTGGLATVAGLPYPLDTANGRLWARKNPAPEVGASYVALEATAGHGAIRGVRVGEKIYWPSTRRTSPRYRHGYYIARAYEGDLVYVSSFAREGGNNGTREWEGDFTGRPDRTREGTYCSGCSRNDCQCTPCGTCGETVAVNERGERYGGLVWHHPACLTLCLGCAAPLRDGDVEVPTDYGPACTLCVHHCPSCDVDIPLPPDRGACRDCTPGPVRDLAGYRHTVPTMWLGGPLPRVSGLRQGFYIGFELEVSSRGGSVNVVRDWAEANLGDREAMDCKSDSTVRGFEIATMPMTPEFFESVAWDSFFQMLERHRTTDRSPSREPSGHGLHVHIGRVAFERDDVATAMFCYLLGQGNHLERIGRREPTAWCRKVERPLSTALFQAAYNGAAGSRQAVRLLGQSGLHPDRSAINLQNGNTIEIRAFRSTRDPEHLKAAVRVVYLAAQYIAHLRGEGVRYQHGKVAWNILTPKALHWSSFMAWVGEVMPEAVEALAEPVPGVAPIPVPSFS